MIWSKIVEKGTKSPQVGAIILLIKLKLEELAQLLAIPSQKFMESKISTPT